VTPRYLPAGESALVVEFGRTIDPEAEQQVLALDAALAASPIEGVLETVPTYRSLMLHFDPRRLTFAMLVAAIRALDVAAAPRALAKRWRIPACYDPPHDEDLADVAALLGLPPPEVAARHAGAEFTVVMYGVAPGFCYLGGLDPALSPSRRVTPRPPSPPGALTIAGGQALIASVAMPTGWYMIGRTPVRTFDPRRDPVFPIAVGDRVRFERIDAARFAALDAEADAGRSALVEAP
jgi:inhibitor of KinA